MGKLKVLKGTESSLKDTSEFPFFREFQSARALLIVGLFIFRRAKEMAAEEAARRKEQSADTINYITYTELIIFLAPTFVKIRKRDIEYPIKDSPSSNNKNLSSTCKDEKERRREGGREREHTSKNNRSQQTTPTCVVKLA